jgi:RecQ family ATP-dependent DNA helicase
MKTNLDALLKSMNTTDKLKSEQLKGIIKIADKPLGVSKRQENLPQILEYNNIPRAENKNEQIVQNVQNMKMEGSFEIDDDILNLLDKVESEKKIPPTDNRMQYNDRNNQAKQSQASGKFNFDSNASFKVEPPKSSLINNFLVGQNKPAVSIDYSNNVSRRKETYTSVNNIQGGGMQYSNREFTNSNNDYKSRDYTNYNNVTYSNPGVNKNVSNYNNDYPDGGSRNNIQSNLNTTSYYNNNNNNYGNYNNNNNIKQPHSSTNFQNNKKDDSFELDFDPNILLSDNECQEITKIPDLSNYTKEQNIKEFRNNPSSFNNDDSEIDITQNYDSAALEEWQKKFEWDTIVETINLRVFGYKTFRPNQREIINANLSQRDIFVCMPTGGGKSLTFQIPALALNGLTIVVMPLTSLIQDQYTQLAALGQNVVILSPQEEARLVSNFDRFFANEYDRVKIMFVTPEKISKSGRTQSLFRKLNDLGLIDRFVIDEAHCLSQWGREFRKDYLNLKQLRIDYPDVPILAVTATATNKVRKDCINQLGMRNCLFFKSSYNRSNLYIEVRQRTGDAVSNMVEFINSKYPKSTGLIYCSSKSDCEKIAKRLKKEFGLTAEYYHADLPKDLKDEIQERWKNDDVKIIVATVAFGMGINKLDVRYVLHNSMPKSFENYYQEIGRAGRDGKKSHCLLYYNTSDRKTQEYLILRNDKKQQKTNLIGLNKMIDYCEDNIECRRVMTLNYFDEQVDPNTVCKGMCDNCRRGHNPEEKDVTTEAKTILELLSLCLRNNLDITAAQIVDVVKTGKKDKLKIANRIDQHFFKSVNNLPQEQIRKIIRKLIIQDAIEELLEATQVGERQNVWTKLRLSHRGTMILRDSNYRLSIVVPASAGYTKANNVQSGTVATESNNNFIEKKKKKESGDNTYNTTNIKPEDLNSSISNNKNLDDLSIKKERKYNRIKSDSNEKAVEPDEDHGLCNEKQFDELLGFLIQRRRDILKEANTLLKNKQHELENIEKGVSFRPLQADDIFPLTGLKELCRKLPTSEDELNSDYIFGVGNHILLKYGKDFLAEIKKFVSINQIEKDRDYYNNIVNKAKVIESCKKLEKVNLTENVIKRKSYAPNRLEESGYKLLVDSPADEVKDSGFNLLKDSRLDSEALEGVYDDMDKLFGLESKKKIKEVKAKADETQAKANELQHIFDDLDALAGIPDINNIESADLSYLDNSLFVDDNEFSLEEVEDNEDESMGVDKDFIKGAKALDKDNRKKRKAVLKEEKLANPKQQYFKKMALMKKFGKYKKK